MLKWADKYEISTIGPCLGPDCHHCQILQDEIKTLTKPKTSGTGPTKKTIQPPFADKHQASLLKEVLKVHKGLRKKSA